MSGTGHPVAVITSASQGIGAGTGGRVPRAQGWAVAANSLVIKPSDDPAA